LETLIVSAGKRSRTVIVDTWISKSITAPTQAYKGVQSLTHFQSTKKFSDNQDERHELLIDSSSTRVTFRDRSKCYVDTGRWYDPYTDRTYSDSSDLHIDHIVSLKYAHERGAHAWPPKLKERFANDRDNIIPVQASANQSSLIAGPQNGSRRISSTGASSWRSSMPSWTSTSLIIRLVNSA